LSFIRFLWFRI